MVGTMVLIRLAKVAMIASLAAYAFIVAYDNIVDYQSNYEFVRHVLSMDTTFHGNALMHRAISNESIWSLAYALIIAMEGSTALLLVVGALGGVDSRDSLLGANQIQGCFWGGSLGCDGTVGFERRGVGADSAADHRPA